MRVTVHGMVQGVGFRYHVLRRALHLEIDGWVRNNADGTVTVLCEGTRGAVVTLIEWLRHGPPVARVRDIHVVEEPYTNRCSGFIIAY